MPAGVSGSVEIPAGARAKRTPPVALRQHWQKLVKENEMEAESMKAQPHFAHPSYWHPSNDGMGRVWPVWRPYSDEPFDCAYVAELDTPEAAVALAEWLSGPTLWDVAGEA
jgi:hypothetical protein